MAARVTDIDGRAWVVRRRWAPRHVSMARSWLERRRAERGGGDGSGWADLFTLPADLDDLAFVAIAIAVIVLLFVAGVPLLLAVVDLAVVLVLTLLGVLARVVLRRPWTVEARSDDGSVVERQVVGWRAAGEQVALLAHEVRVSRARP